MKIKNRITDKWSLECKDDYQSIREKVSFNEHSVPKNRIVFKSVMFSMASIIVVFLLLIPLINNFFGVGNGGNNMSGGNAAQGGPNINSPSKDDDKNEFNGGANESVPPGNSNDNVGNGSISGGDSKPGASDYESFISSIDFGYIDSSYIEYIKYIDKTSELKITNFTKIIEFLNSLEYTDYEDDDVLNADYMIVVNNGWATFVFDESCYISVKYDNHYATYSTNVDNILEAILEYLK